MDARQERGRQIAATAKITQRDRGTWIVPSQSDKGRYAVTISKDGKFCTCPDFELRQLPCKHVFAVQYVLFRETTTNGDSTTVKETACRARHLCAKLACVQLCSGQRERNVPEPASRFVRECTRTGADPWPPALASLGYALCGSVQGV